MATLCDIVPYPWHISEAERLCAKLIEAYAEVREASFVAKTAGISLAGWNSQQSPRLAWQDLLEIAAKQNLLRKLVEVILDDHGVRAYHAEVRVLAFHEVPLSIASAASSPPTVASPAAPGRAALSGASRAAASARASRLADAGAGAPSASAIYVPRCQIRNDEWLFANYFLWDRIYRIVPRGIEVKPSGLERRLLRAAPEFSPRIDVAPIIAGARELYGGVVERCQDKRWLEKMRAAELIASYPQEVIVHDEKTDTVLLAQWEEHQILSGRSKSGYRVKRFWADLWLTVLAREAGRRDGIAPITDDPLTGELIRLLALAEEETSGNTADARNALQPHLAAGLVGVAIPAPGIALEHRARLDLASLPLAKRKLRSLREAFHRYVADEIERFPMHLEDTAGLQALLTEARAAYAAHITPSLLRELPALCLRFVQSVLLVHRTPHRTGGPPLLEYQVARALEKS